jgi:hypothetical protein
VTLAGARVKMVGKAGKYQCSPDDVNDDGFADFMCHVQTVQFFIEPGETMAVLEAATDDGQMIRGQDAIRIVR